MFFGTALFLVVEDVAYRIANEVNKEPHACNDSLFDGSASWLNSVVWLLSRGTATLSSVFITIYLFRTPSKSSEQ